MKRLAVLAVVGVIALLILSQAFFTVDETQKAIVLQMGKPVRDTVGPGLHLKWPFVESVVYIDSRVLTYETTKAEVLTKDKQNLVVDNFAKFRISDPLQFYRTLGTVERAKTRLDDLVYAEVRVAIGNYSMKEVVSSRRAEIMALVTGNVNKTVKEFGLELVDVRIKRTDLPPQNEQAIFGRMKAERERDAKRYRSEGVEEAAKITSEADKERTIILAEAGRVAEVTRGEGDAAATAIYANALGQSPDFYSFMRSMEAYKASLAENTRVIMTPGSGFLQYLK